jgi:hypothetical protein
MIMNDWLHNLPIVWMALLVFGLTALVTAAINLAVMVLSVGERARSFKAVSPGMLPPLGILFALFIAFTASQVWTRIRRSMAAHHHQSFAGQLGQMVMPSLASGVRAARDRHGT